MLVVSLQGEWIHWWREKAHVEPNVFLSVARGANDDNNTDFEIDG